MVFMESYGGLWRIAFLHRLFALPLYSKDVEIWICGCVCGRIAVLLLTSVAPLCVVFEKPSDTPRIPVHWRRHRKGGDLVVCTERWRMQAPATAPSRHSCVLFFPICPHSPPRSPLPPPAYITTTYTLVTTA